MQIRWTEGASKNLNEIEQYIAGDNPQRAIETILEIIEVVEHLSDHPKLGRLGRVKGTRELVIPNTAYIVAYRVHAEAVEILRVLHNALLWPAKL